MVEVEARVVATRLFHVEVQADDHLAEAYAAEGL